VRNAILWVAHLILISLLFQLSAGACRESMSCRFITDEVATPLGSQLVGDAFQSAAHPILTSF